MSNIGNENVVTALEKAKQELDDAVTSVAQAAQMLADSSVMRRTTKHDANYDSASLTYTVEVEDMDELKDALKVWKEKTQNFLSEVAKAGG